MGTSVETAWNRFRRIVVNPYWCEGSPLAWEVPASKTGIAYFAHTSKVGHFNLAWWILQRKEPPMDAAVYKNTKSLLWVIMAAPNIRFGPWSLTDMASFMTQAEWERWLLTQEAHAYQFAGQGVTYRDLKWIAERNQRR